MEVKKKGNILMIVGLIIAIGTLITIPALAYFNRELVEKIILFNNMEWIIFLIGIVIAGYGEYLRR